MPGLTTACRKHGCPAIVHGDYCDDHGPEDNRPPASQRGYDGEWRRFRNAYLAENPWCEDPEDRHVGLVGATEVDHIERLDEGGARLDPENVQALCRSCHERKKARERSG